MGKPQFYPAEMLDEDEDEEYEGFCSRHGLFRPRPDDDGCELCEEDYWEEKESQKDNSV